LNPLLASSLLQPGFIFPALIILVLLILSALFSASEVAFFSLGPSKLDELRQANDESSARVIELLEDPDKESASKKLLATVLIANNFVNVGIVLLSSAIMPYLFVPKTGATQIAGLVIDGEWLTFLVQVVGVTFFLVLFGEVIPKVYASSHNLSLARSMAFPISIIQKLLSPISRPLVGSTAFLERRLSSYSSGISVSDLEHALELTQREGRSEEEQKILEGIVSFGSKDVKQIMTSRVDITAFPDDMPYSELLQKIIETGYSRVPIYTESIDQIRGILYIKDLLPYSDQQEFSWIDLLRPQFFVPENKKIDDLLREFQHRKVHMAIVVDEYGGTSGLVTLEDVIEEIVGDITDEFDDDDIHYSKIDDNNFVFEGKTALIDLYRIIEIEGDAFEAVKGDSDSLAGFIIEQAGKIPVKGEKIHFANFTFTVEAADRRKVKQIKITIHSNNEGSHNE
jgi:gliding motility-associated protein GldE